MGATHPRGRMAPVVPPGTDHGPGLGWVSPATGRSRRTPPPSPPDESDAFPQLWSDATDSVPEEPAYLLDQPPAPDDADNPVRVVYAVQAPAPNVTVINAPQPAPTVIINQNYTPDRPAPVMRDYSNERLPEAAPGLQTYQAPVPNNPEGRRGQVAIRHETDDKPTLRLADLQGALEVIRPVSRGDSPDVSLGSITLDDVGDMVETKQALTETVLWPLQHPDTFTRLGVEPPRGVLLFGPPGCGKTFVVRALAASGRLSVHTVKGAELMDKWVGASEKAVRDLFARARESAPSLIFLDEVDALAPRRGQSTDSGVTDRVVASLLTELDGVEPLSDVVVLGATNRPDLIDPALLRPGRLERLVFVPPPDAAARGDILRASGKNVPLADDIVIDDLAADLDGYSAADCSALLREAALSAMRRDIDAATVTADDIAAARERVRPSLDAEQVENLRAYADRRLD